VAFCDSCEERLHSMSGASCIHVLFGL
jgi:hypothetical protein